MNIQQRITLAVARYSNFVESEHPRDHGKFAEKAGDSDDPSATNSVSNVGETGAEGGKMEAATVKELDSESAWWNKTAAGQDVIRWEHSNHFPVKVGDTVSLDGKTVTITAMGEPFKTKAGRKMVYLYPETPQKRTQPFVPASRRESESPDDPMERMEWLKNRGIGGGSAGDAG